MIKQRKLVIAAGVGLTIGGLMMSFDGFRTAREFYFLTPSSVRVLEKQVNEIASWNVTEETQAQRDLTIPRNTEI